ncbi:MAG: C1 family peptidase [Kiritimatiellae bacterium]|nr:C1 family peptidase [Kiritimatiellia bacterium]
MKNLLPHRVSLVDHMPSIMRQGSRNTCAAAAAVLLAEYRFGEGTRLSVQYLFAETAKREQEWIGRNIAALRSGEAPDAAFKAAYPTQMAELDLVREAAGAGSDEEKSFLDVFESCQNKRLRGQSLRRCLETLVESGVCRNSLWPYDPNAIDRAASELPDGTRDDARRRRIARRAVYILDSPGNVDEVKGLLCGLNGRLPAPIAVTLSAADPKRDPLGHALVVVGYEDDPMNPGEGWFLLQNSWGTEWGDGGYGKISYGEFSRRCVEAGALVVPRRRKLFSALTIAAALLLAGGVALVAALSGDCPKAGPDWWTDAPWTNGTLNVCADISKGAYDTCPTKLRTLLFGGKTNAPSVSVGRCLFGVDTLDLSSTHVLLLLARAPHGNYTSEQKQVIRYFLEEGGIVLAFLCECNFDCMGDLLAPYGLKLHRQTANVSLVGTVPQSRRFDIEGTANATVEVLQGGWTTLVKTDSVHPRPVLGCRRVGKGLLVYVPQKMFGRGVNRNLNANFWTSMLTAVAQAGGSPAKGRVADQSADEAPVQVREGRTLVCASEALRKEARDCSRKLAQDTNDVRVLLCDSTCQDQKLCGKRTFRHLGAFRKGQTNR